MLALPGTTRSLLGEACAWQAEGTWQNWGGCRERGGQLASREGEGLFPQDLGTFSPATFPRRWHSWLLALGLARHG